jgi:hypothetical protein
MKKLQSARVAGKRLYNGAKRGRKKGNTVSPQGWRSQPRFRMPCPIPARQGSRECKQSARSVAGRLDIRVFLCLIISRESRFDCSEVGMCQTRLWFICCTTCYLTNVLFLVESVRQNECLFNKRFHSALNM